MLNWGYCLPQVASAASGTHSEWLQSVSLPIGLRVEIGRIITKDDAGNAPENTAKKGQPGCSGVLRGVQSGGGQDPCGNQGRIASNRSSTTSETSCCRFDRPDLRKIALTWLLVVDSLVLR